MLNSRTLQKNGFIGFASKSLVSPVMAKVAKHCVLLFKTRNLDALRIHDAQRSATITKIIYPEATTLYTGQSPNSYVQNNRPVFKERKNYGVKFY